MCESREPWSRRRRGGQATHCGVWSVENGARERLGGSGVEEGQRVGEWRFTVFCLRESKSPPKIPPQPQCESDA